MKRQCIDAAFETFLLPRDITTLVAVRYLTVRDVMRWLATCRHYHSLLTERCPEFWRRVSIVTATDSYAGWRRIHLDVFDRGYAPGSESVRLFIEASPELQTAMLRTIHVHTGFFHTGGYGNPDTIDMSRVPEGAGEPVPKLFPLDLALVRPFQMVCPTHCECDPSPYVIIAYMLPKGGFSLNRIVRTCPHDRLMNVGWATIDRPGGGGGVLVARVVQNWKHQLLELS